MNFEKHLNNLEEELCLLSDKIAQARENENWGTYKNLILSYKEILNLISNFNIKVNNVTEDIEENKFTIPAQFFFKEIRHNSNYKIGDFKADCPIIIDDSVNEFEFIIGLTIADKDFKITSEDFRKRVVSESKEMLDKSYKWGGNTPEDGFDCSGLIQYIYKNYTGLKIGRNLYEQMRKGISVNKNNLRIADVVFFGELEKPHHAGIYIGNNQYIHASKLGDVVRISNLNDRDDFIFAKRYF